VAEKLYVLPCLIQGAGHISTTSIGSRRPGTPGSISIGRYV